MARGVTLPVSISMDPVQSWTQILPVLCTERQPDMTLTGFLHKPWDSINYFACCVAPKAKTLVFPLALDPHFPC